MGARLKATILRWKAKSAESTKKKQKAKAALLKARQRIKKLEQENEVLRARLAPQGVAYHTYPAQMIAMAVFMVVHAGSSLRCASKTLGFLSQMLGWSYGSPSHSTIRNWVLRCGLYCLEYGTEKTGKYVGIIDESIQIGREKLLLLLGLKLPEDRSHAAPLMMSDVEVLGMEVQQSWTGEDVAEFIEKRMERHKGIELLYMIADQGTALKSGLCKLGIALVGDCSHVMMNIVKRLFETDGGLAELCAQIGGLRRKLLLTEHGHLLPPTLRDKDRFMRIFTVVEWSDRIMKHWEKLSESVRPKLNFLVQAQGVIADMRQVKELVALTAKLLKSAGLSSVSHQKWEARIDQFRQENALNPKAEVFIQTLRRYFTSHENLMNQYGRLLCSSDIIESTFGKYKNKGGVKVISADVLSIALYGQEITPDFIQIALSNTHNKDLEQWAQRFTCDNRFSILRRMDRDMKSAA